MKQWKQWAMAAVVVAGAFMPASSLAADMSPVKVDVIGGKAMLPKAVNVVTLSKTNMIPYSLKEAESNIKKVAQYDPSKATEKTSQKDSNIFLGEQNRRQDIMDYNNANKILNVINSFRLGEYTDVYQWQLKNEDGRQTALVAAVALDQNNPLTHFETLNEPTIDSALIFLNYSINKKLQSGEPLMEGNGILGNNPDGAQVDYTMKVTGMQPVIKLTGTKYPTYVSGADMNYVVGGFEQHFPVYAALVLEPNSTVAYIMTTSDSERATFAPIFRNFVKSIK